MSEPLARYYGCLKCGDHHCDVDDPNLYFDHIQYAGPSGVFTMKAELYEAISAHLAGRPYSGRYKWEG